MTTFALVLVLSITTGCGKKQVATEQPVKQIQIESAAQTDSKEDYTIAA